MNDDILQVLAQQFQKAEENNHELVFGHGNTEHRITIALSDEMFTHSFGLEHIDSMRAEIQGRNPNRIALFQDLLQHGRLISNLPAAEQHSLENPIVASFNPLTQKECTLAERLTALLSFSDIMQKLHECKVYEFQPRAIFFESKAKKPNGRPLAKFKRDVSIQADFVVKMAMPSQTGADSYNLFLCFAKNKHTEHVERFGKKRLCTCSVTLVSAFADGVDITARQPECKMLKHTILDKATHKKTIPFVLPNYVPIDRPAPEPPLKNTNIIQPQFKPLPRADVLTAADRPPQKKSILDRLRDLVSGIAAKIREVFSSPAQQRPASKQRHSAAPAQRRTTEQDKGTSDHADRAAQDHAHGEPQQATTKKAHTISHAKRSDIKAQAQRAGHPDKAHHRGVQAHGHDDELS